MANTVEIVLKMRGSAQVQAQIKGIQGAFASMREGWQNISGVLAAAGITAAIREMWRAAEEARVATYRLTTALEASGQASFGVASALIAQAEALESLTGVSDETVLAVQAILLSMGATADQVERLTPLVLDVSAAMGTDATTAARQLGQALDGEEIQLGRLNIKVKTFDQLLEVLNSRVKGQAAALMQAKGPAAELGVEIGKLSESLGEMLSRVSSSTLSKFSGWLREANQAVTGLNSIWDLPESLQERLSQAGVSRSVTPGTQFRGSDQETESIEGERARRAGAAQDLLRVEADINNLYAFRHALVSGDPTMGEVEKQEALARVMRDELPVLQQREDLLRSEYERQLRGDPGLTLQTTIDAERDLNDALLDRLQTSQRIRAIESSATFSGALSRQVDQLRTSYQNLSVAMAGVTFDTVTAGVQGLSGALTSVIMGSKSAGQAFAEFGLQLLTNFISTILTAVLYATVAIPILTALGVLSGGATAATGAGVTTAALASGMAAASAATSGGFNVGGYTGDGPTMQVAGVVHRGEFVVPAYRTQELGVGNLESMAFGGGGGDPMRVVILDHRGRADELMRDRRFRSFLVDLQAS